MRSREVSTVLTAPQRAVWEALTDMAAKRGALRHVVGLEVLTDGPFQQGTVWRESRKLLGITVTRTVEVSAVHEPVGYELCVRCNGTWYRSTTQLVARSPETTQVTMQFDPRPRNDGRHTIARVLGQLHALAAERYMRADLDDLVRQTQRRFT